MKYLFPFAFIIVAMIGLFELHRFHQSRIMEDRKFFCQKGWRHSAARYRVYDKISVKQLRLDAENFCKGWQLE